MENNNFESEMRFSRALRITLIAAQVVILFTVIFCGLASCSDHSPRTSVIEDIKEESKTSCGHTIETIIHNDCEYVVVCGGPAVEIVHKANCINPIHHGK